MATNTRQHAVKFALKANGSLIGGGRGVLRRSAETGNPIPQTEDLFQRVQPLKRDWMLDITELQFLEGAGTPTWIKGSTANVSAGGNDIKGIQLIQLNYAADNPDVTDLDDALDTARLPGMRSGTLSVEGNYYDPAATLGAGFNSVHNSYQAGTLITYIVTFGAAQSYTFSGGVTACSGPEKGGNQASKFSFQAGISGQVTVVNTNADSGLAAIIDSIHHATQPQSITALVTNAVTGDTEYTGAVYPASLNIRIPTATNALVTATGQLVAASGAYTEQAVST